MCTGNLRLFGVAITLALAALAVSACGSSDDGPTAVQPAVSRETAEQLAKISDRIASDLDSGDTCHAAHAADDLKAAVEQSDLPDSMRSSVDETAGRLVDEVNCPPPPPPPPQEKKKPKEKKHKEDHHGDEHKNPGHGGTPPGQAKLQGGFD